MSKRDYYEILGLTKGATADEIKKAYRKLALEHHPDKGGDTTLFQEIAEAYSILSDPDKRAKYDQFGHNHPHETMSDDSVSDLLKEFIRRHQFGGFNGPQTSTVRKGAPKQMTIKLSLEDIFNGTKKEYRFQKKVKCTSCEGHGGTSPTSCATCGGSGQVVEVTTMAHGYMRQIRTCSDCNGHGTTYTDECNDCHGSGVISIEDTLTLNLPHGLAQGMQMIIQGAGDSIKGGEAGDMILTIIELPHERFVRSGNDLRYRMRLTYTQFVLGDKVELETIEGKRIRVTIPKFTKVTDTLRIPKKGLKMIDSEERGDLLIEMDLIIPTEITSEEEELLNTLKKLEKNLAP